MMRVLFASTLFISAVSARLRTDPAAVQEQQQQQPQSKENRTLHVIDKQFIVQTAKTAGGGGAATNIHSANMQAAILSLDANAVIKHEYRHAFTGFAVSGVTEAILQALADDNPGSILSIEPDYKITVDTVWGIDRVDQTSLPLDNVYQPPNNLTGAGVDIYIIDVRL
jgi:hypothetical protein